MLRSLEGVLALSRPLPSWASVPCPCRRAVGGWCALGLHQARRPPPRQCLFLLPGKPVSGLQGNGASEPQGECAGGAGINTPPWQPLETALLPPSVPSLQRGRSRLPSLPQLNASAGPGSQMDTSPTSALTTPWSLALASPGRAADEETGAENRGRAACGTLVPRPGIKPGSRQ